MFDFHTHILPGIDDGSRSVEESLSMLCELKRQGASGIAATPHFYAESSSPEKFFEKRQAAWNRLKPLLEPELPEIRLGAEVRYFEGISRYEGLERFCIEGTKLLLVEMPEGTWTTRMTSAIAEINRCENIIVLLAHMERYLPYGNIKNIEKLAGQGVLLQASTGFFIKKHRTAMKMLRRGWIHLLGTDSHNMNVRKPDLAPALDIITRKKGEQWLAELEQREAVVLDEKENNQSHMRYGNTGIVPDVLR